MEDPLQQTMEQRLQEQQAQMKPVMDMVNNPAPMDGGVGGQRGDPRSAVNGGENGGPFTGGGDPMQEMTGGMSGPGDKIVNFEDTIRVFRGTAGIWKARTRGFAPTQTADPSAFIARKNKWISRLSCRCLPTRHRWMVEWVDREAI